MSQPEYRRLVATVNGATPPSTSQQPQPGEKESANRRLAPAVRAQAAHPTLAEYAIPRQGEEDGFVEVHVECSLAWTSRPDAEPPQPDANAAIAAFGRKRKAEGDIPGEPPQQKPRHSPSAQARSSAFSAVAGDVHADLPPLVSASGAARDGDAVFLSQLAELRRYGFSVVEMDAAKLTLGISSRHPGGSCFMVAMQMESFTQSRNVVELIDSILDAALSQSRLGVADILASHGWHPAPAWARDADLVRRAATECRGHLLQALLCRGADVVTPDRDGKTVLHHAVEAGAADMLELLANPTTINHADSNGDTPLLSAIGRGDGLDSCAALLRMSADTEVRDRHHDTALHRAIRPQRTPEIAALLRAGANPDARDASGNTPLHLACAQGNDRAVLLLLSRNAATQLRNERGLRAFDVLAGQGEEQGTYDLLRYLTPVDAQE